MEPIDTEAHAWSQVFKCSSYCTWALKGGLYGQVA